MRLVAIASVMFAAGAAWAGPKQSVPRVLISPDLSRKSVEVISMDSERVEVRGIAGKNKTVFIAARDVLALIADGAVKQPMTAELVRYVPGRSAPGSSAGSLVDRRTAIAPVPEIGKEEPVELMVALTDGERLGGTLVASEGKGEEFLYEISGLGTVKVPLTMVSELATWADTGEEAARGKDDVVLLANGDKLTGFVANIRGGENAGIALEAGGKTQELELSRIGRVVFANELEPTAGSKMYLSSGAVVKVKSLRALPAAGGYGGVEYTATLMGADGKAIDGSTSLQWVAAYVREASGLVGLASLRMPKVTAGPGRRWTPGVTVLPALVRPVGMADIELPGPVAAEWELPAGARRFSADVELPAAGREWGECSVVVDAGGKELARVKLDGEHPSGTINVEVTGVKLRVSVVEGSRGPVENRVVLRGALLLVGK